VVFKVKTRTWPALFPLPSFLGAPTAILSPFASIETLDPRLSSLLSPVISAPN
jgi:hypothetical protein